MNIQVVNLRQKSNQILKIHSYKLIAELNNYQLKLVRAKREFVWHHHDETDELFMVVGGKMQIALRDKMLDLKEGEMVVIPRGVDHKPVCPEGYTVLLIEPKGTCNTGNAGGALTDDKAEWI
jgi:mannose-6-phosphate isomerase-like protein (cupin superfamily)